MDILALEISTSSRTEEGLFDPREVVRLTLECGRELASGRRIDAVSLSSVWHSLILRDSDMNPVSPLYHWDYTRPAALCSSLRQDESRAISYYRRTGCVVNPIYPAFRIKYLQDRLPEIRSACFMSIGSYLTRCLTGRMVSSRCLASGSGLFNIHTGAYDEETLSWLGIGEDRLSPLTETGETFPLNEEGAALLGLTAGIPVIPANSDGALNQVGAGALKKGVATLSVGTSGAVRLTTDSPLIPEKPSTWCYRSPAGYLSGAATNGCCNCIDWARNTLFAPGATYSEMESGIPDDADVPVFLPFMFGERCPGWDGTRLGGFAGLKPSHDAHAMYRAIQEGVLFNLYHCYSILTETAGHPDEIKVSGGILSSDKWLQMCADIFGCTLKVDRMQQGSIFGACVLAAGVLGEIGDITEYSPATVREVVPDHDKAALYQEKYQKYLQAYSRG